MREILFRGKRTDNGEWVYGAFSEYDVKLDERGEIIVYRDPCIIDYSDELLWNEVDPETVGQYTGLTDKNGRKIFEGDVLRIARSSNGNGDYYFPPLEYPVKVVVKWDLCAWMWETLCKDKRYIRFPDAWYHYECEVIGNAHDHPELLEE